MNRISTLYQPFKFMGLPGDPVSIFLSLGRGILTPFHQIPPAISQIWNDRQALANIASWWPKLIRLSCPKATDQWICWTDKMWFLTVSGKFFEAFSGNINTKLLMTWRECYSKPKTLVGKCVYLSFGKVGPSDFPQFWKGCSERFSSALEGLL